MFEGLFQPLHLIVIFFIATLVFGPRKLADLGKGLGQGIREFKDAIRDQGPTQSSMPHEKEKDSTSVD